MFLWDFVAADVIGSHVVENDPELWSLLSLYSKCGDYRNEL